MPFTCCNLLTYGFVFYPWAWLGNFNLNIPLASKYARFVVLGRLMYWTPRSDHWTPPLKSDDIFLGTKRYWTPPFKNPGHIYITPLPRKQKFNFIICYQGRYSSPTPTKEILTYISQIIHKDKMFKSGVVILNSSILYSKYTSVYNV